VTTFDELYRAAVRFRHVSRELEALVRDVHANVRDVAAVERLLVFLASPAGRTDANCDAVHHFFDAVEPEWTTLPDPLRGIFDDMSGTMRESIYRPDIARTFEALPEQLLERVRKL
jgi:hypothetical protein